MSFTSKTLPGLTVNIREKAPTASHGDGGEKTAHFKICPECSVLLNKIHHQESSSSRLVTKSCPTLATPWTVACQAPLSMGSSRQEYWSGLPFPSPGDLPDPGSNLGLRLCRQILY